MLPIFKLCLLNRHEPVRAEVRNDRFDYVGHCRKCGCAIRRRGKGHWVRDRTPPAPA